MRLKRELQLLFWLLFLKGVVWLVIGIQLKAGFRVLSEFDKSTRHSNDVMRTLNEAKDLFQQAEIEGRHATIDAASRENFPLLAARAEKAITPLIEMVADNKTQTTEARTIQSAMVYRFSTQRRTIEAARVVNGVLQNDPELVGAGMRAQSTVNQAFVDFERTERELLTSRYQSVWDSIWTIFQYLAGLLTFGFLEYCVVTFWTWRRNKKARIAIQDMEDIERNKHLKIENEQLKFEVEAYRQGVKNAIALLDS